MTDARTVVKRHPIRGAIWGFVMGLGVTVYLILFAVIGISSITGTIVTAVIISLVFAGLGVAWAMFGPAKKPKGPAPAAAGSAPPAAPAASDG